MSWGNALRKQSEPEFFGPVPIEPDPIDWDRLVTVDFETYFDNEYTLKKLSTSEYIRDPRFKAQCVAIKIGRKPTRVYPHNKVKAMLQAIPWATHSLLAHHAQFDGFIMGHHFGIHPKKIYCTLSMARALHSNDIGAGLEEVSVFYGGGGKLKDILEHTRGVLKWPKALYNQVVPYCANDNEECYRVFTLMHPKMPRDEMDIIDFTCRMFTDPVLKVDLPRVQKELEREIAAKRELMLKVAAKASDIKLSRADLKPLGDNPTDEDIAVRKAKKLIGSNAFADLLRDEGIEPPVKISPAWINTPVEERCDENKWAYAFAKTDLDFVKLQEHPRQQVRDLVEARLSVKSTTNETRAGRFLKAGENGAPLPVYLKYGAAHTLRWGGGNKMNMQNLKRGGELRKSILAPPGHVLVVVDSGQIEARTNAWLWDEVDLLDDFRRADVFTATQLLLPKDQRRVARGADRDAYCKFGDTIYGREITTDDKDERFVGKVGILGLGYQMGPARFQSTLALGLMGPPVFFDLEECERIVRAYRRKNQRIVKGWAKCQDILEDMARGIPGSYKCISWDKETIYLPNGMQMRYPGLHDKRIPMLAARKLAGKDIDLTDGEFDFSRPQYVYDRKGEESKIYGGLLCENIVQCLARLIVAKQLLVIARKHRIVMTTHDEGAFLAKKAQGQKVYDFARNEFTKALPWCADLPLNAEGGFDIFYSK